MLTYRLLTLEWPVMLMLTISTSQLEGKSLSNGQPLKALNIDSTVQPVMCGAMECCCLRYGHWVAIHTRELPLTRCVGVACVRVGCCDCVQWGV